MKYKMIGLILVVSILTIGTIVYNLKNNNSVVVVNQEIEIDKLPKEFEKFTIIQLTDLHSKEFGKDQGDLINLINSLDFDMIAITGDMQNRQDEDYKPFITLVEGIDNKENIFYTPGNHGPMIYEGDSSFNSFIKGNIREVNSTSTKAVFNNNVATYENSNNKKKADSNNIEEKKLTEAGIKLKQLGVKFLDEVYSIKIGEEVLWVSELRYLDEFIKETNGEYKEGDIKIALTHYPMSKSVYEGDVGKNLGNYDLVLAGHYHGGQWRLPYIGGLFIPDVHGDGFFPSEERISGLTNWGGFKQYVSRGIGAGGPLEIFRFRFFNKPEINLIKLVKK